MLKINALARGKSNARNDDFNFQLTLGSDRHLLCVGDFTGESSASVAEDFSRYLAELARARASEAWFVEEPSYILRELFEAANAELLKRNNNDIGPYRTAMAAAVVGEGSVAYCSTGDCGVGAWREGKMSFAITGDVTGKRDASSHLPHRAYSFNMKDVKYMALPPGAMLLLFSDGLWAEGTRDARAEVARVAALIEKELNAGSGGDALLRALEESWDGGDDLCMLAAEMLPATFDSTEILDRVSNQASVLTGRAQEALDMLQEWIKVADDKFKGLPAKADEVVQALDGTVDEAKGVISQWRENIDTSVSEHVKKEVGIVTSGLQTVVSSVHSISDDLGTFKEELGEIKAARKALESTQKELSELKGNLEAASGLSTVKDDLESVKEELASVRGDLNKVKEGLETTKKEFNALLKLPGAKPEEEQITLASAVCGLNSLVEKLGDHVQTIVSGGFGDTEEGGPRERGGQGAEAGGEGFADQGQVYIDAEKRQGDGKPWYSLRIKRLLFIVVVILVVCAAALLVPELVDGPPQSGEPVTEAPQPDNGTSEAANASGIASEELEAPADTEQDALAAIKTFVSSKLYGDVLPQELKVRGDSLIAYFEKPDLGEEDRETCGELYQALGLRLLTMTDVKALEAQQEFIAALVAHVQKMTADDGDKITIVGSNFTLDPWVELSTTAEKQWCAALQLVTSYGHENEVAVDGDWGNGTRAAIRSAADKVFERFPKTGDGETSWALYTDYLKDGDSLNVEAYKAPPKAATEQAGETE